jgi:hypothetical protein
LIVSCFVGRWNLQSFRRCGIAAVKEAEEPSTTDRGKDLGTPSRVVRPRQLVRRRGAQVDDLSRRRRSHGVNDEGDGGGEDELDAISFVGEEAGLIPYKKIR